MKTLLLFLITMLFALTNLDSMGNTDKVKKWRENPDYDSGIKLAKELGLKQPKFSNIDFLFYAMCKAVDLHGSYYTENTFYKDGKLHISSVSEKIESEAEYEDVPIDFEYKLKIEEYPLPLQQQIIYKGTLYNERDVLIKKLFNSGTSNDPKTIASRKAIILDIKDKSQQIIKIYSDLKTFEDTGEFKEELKEETNNEPDISQMSFFEKKDYLTRLRKQVGMAEKRISSYKKPDLIAKNTEKIEQSRKIIKLLESDLNAKEKTA